jgi:putative SOS response-associated peptidase YedK
MPAWKKGPRVLVLVSWFYEFDARVKPQVPYAVFSLERRFWVMAGLGSWTRNEAGEAVLSVAIITVAPNQVLQSVGHHRSPAIIQTPGEALSWLRGPGAAAREVLRPHPDENMGVEAVPMNVKIPGNQDIQLPEVLLRRTRRSH